MMRLVLDRVKNNVENWRKSWLPELFPLPILFLTPFLTKGYKDLKYRVIPIPNSSIF